MAATSPASAKNPTPPFFKRESLQVSITISAPIAAVVSCAGFQDVTKTSSVLIQNLIRRGVCAPNASKRGFAINAEYEASQGCYVMGPLVAGNILGTFKVWHAESCTRIIHMSKQLAEILARE